MKRHSLSAPPVAMLAVLLAVSVAGLTARPAPPGIVTKDLAEVLRRNPHQAVRVIVKGRYAKVVAAAARRHRVKVERMLDEFVVVSATPSQVERLRSDFDVTLLARDVPIGGAMATADRAMAADQTRAGAPGVAGVGAFPGVTGLGVGVAIVDSGIAQHLALANKVVAAVSFVQGDSSVDDLYGHGTHIAGIIAGAASAASGVTTEYSGGIAPDAHLINVRVLGADGSGLTSNVIAAIDWVIANRTQYGIRVVNLSLGHPITEACVLDPLCSSVERAVQSGLIVVVSAGNRGKTADGQPALGTVTSPGNSPFALTVGAVNTWGTVARADDTITTYSSRGPTAVDLGLKPDVVAPGNKILSLEAQNSYLANNYPASRIAGSGQNAYYQMSGTSMAAGMVSGGVALLLEAFPNLTAANAKLALQLTASFKPTDGSMAAGTGSVNLWSARRVAGDPLTGPWPSSNIGGVDAVPSGLAFLAGALQVLGVLNPFESVDANQMLWGGTTSMTSGQQLIWGDQVYNPQGQQLIWGDSTTINGQQLIWGDSHIEGDQ